MRKVTPQDLKRLEDIARRQTAVAGRVKENFSKVAELKRALDLELARGSIIHAENRDVLADLSALQVEMGQQPLPALLPHETLPPPTPEQLALVRAADATAATPRAPHRPAPVVDRVDQRPPGALLH